MIQRYLRFAGYLLPVFTVCTSVALLGARVKPSGDDPYTPTKREWVCVVFNAEDSVDFLESKNWSVVARPSKTEPNTVSLFVGKKPDMRRETLNELLAIYKQHLQTIAKNHGFEEWLIIEERIRDFD